MCLYPKIRLNKKYKPNKSNGGIIPPVTDKRQLYVAYGCGKCSECRKQRANGWKTRLMEEIRTNNNGTFVTNTLSDESIVQLAEIIKKEMPNTSGYELENEIAKLAVKRFRERWRQETGKSPKHWLITELGHTGSERIHIHGIIWSDENKNVRDERIKRLWQYGHQYNGTYMNERTGGYITKYMLKTDLQHKEYTPIILTSPGIGKGFIESPRAEQLKYKPDGGTINYYRHRNGMKGALPTYYKNKLYSEEEKGKLWTEMLDKNVRYVKGEEIRNTDTIEGLKIYEECREWHRQKDKRLGYGTDEKNWDRVKYENDRREMLMQKRYEKLKKQYYGQK